MTAMTTGTTTMRPRPVRRTRLTRRGRVLRTVLLLLGLVLIVLQVPSDGAGADEAVDGALGDAAPRAVRVVVRPGDTLFGLVQQHLVGGQPHVVADRAARANDVEPRALRPGQVLWLPVQS